jgi:hypothetical protein
MKTTKMTAKQQSQIHKASIITFIRTNYNTPHTAKQVAYNTAIPRQTCQELLIEIVKEGGATIAGLKKEDGKSVRKFICMKDHLTEVVHVTKLQSITMMDIVNHMKTHNYKRISIGDEVMIIGYTNGQLKTVLI